MTEQEAKNMLAYDKEGAKAQNPAALFLTAFSDETRMTLV